MIVSNMLDAGRLRCSKCGQFCSTYARVLSRDSAGMPDIEQCCILACTCGHTEHVPLEPNGLVIP